MLYAEYAFCRMENSSLTTTEIRETVRALGNVRSANEIDNQLFEDRTKKLFDRTFDYYNNKIPKSAASEVPRAFLEGDPSKAYNNLIELRSGRSLTDQSGPFRPSSVLVDIENEQSHFSKIYRNYNGSLTSALQGFEFCENYLSGGCVEAGLRELGSCEFIKYRDKPFTESPTARAINIHLCLLYNVSSRESLKPRLSAELQRSGYFPILREFTRSAYVLKPILLYFLEILFIDKMASTVMPLNFNGSRSWSFYSSPF